MKINFTKKEYRDLIDLIEIADWILHAQKARQPKGTLNYVDLRRKILSFAKEMGCENLVYYDKQRDEYYETKEYEETSGCLEYIEEYEDEAFWGVLSSRLAMRDLTEQEGEETLKQMPIADLADRRLTLESWYDKEFRENGVDNVRVVSDKPRAKDRPH